MLYALSMLWLGITSARRFITAGPGLAEDFSMTIEIIYLTAQIQRWLDVRVARHLAAQAAKFTH
jgi:hypothetical protein